MKVLNKKRLKSMYLINLRLDTADFRIEKSFLVDLFNVVLRFIYFHLKWKTATVIVIPKKGKTVLA